MSISVTVFFQKNLTIALCTLPFKTYDLCPITDFTYVLEEVYMTMADSGTPIRAETVHTRCT